MFLATNSSASHLTATAMHTPHFALKYCSACNVSFETDSLRRAHAKTQWHVENIRRRAAGLSPIAANTIPPEPTKSKSMGESTQRLTESDRSISPSPESDGDSPAEQDMATFVPEACLFCQAISPNFDASVTHMEQSHGLRIRNIKSLAVDLETLVQYLHLVIFGYRECLSCHTQRRTVQAVQQHMRGKGHCKIDLESPESEYRDFLEGDGEESGIGAASSDGEFARLPSGRVVLSRTSKPARQPRASESLRTTPGLSQGDESAPVTEAPVENSGASSSRAVVKREMREDRLAGQLASLRVSDRAALAHLSTSQQLAVLATERKQAAQAKRAETRYRSRLEMKGNRTLMGNFVSDIHGDLPVQMYG